MARRRNSACHGAQLREALFGALSGAGAPGLHKVAFAFTVDVRL
jgi:hypothetical protein